MEALVFADRVGNELLPLTKGRPVALLPVNGESLIGHTLADLADAEVRSAVVVVGDSQASALEDALGSGQKWGVDVDLVKARRGESPTQLARRLANRLPDKFLAMRGDVYRSRSIGSFRSAANNVLATQVTAQINGRCAQLVLCRQRDMFLDHLSWEPSQSSRAANWRTIDLRDGEFSNLFDTTDFYLANIDGLEDRVAQLSAASGGRDRRCYAGSGSEFEPGIVRDGPVLIGRGCRIGRATLRLITMLSAIAAPSMMALTKTK